MKCQSLFARENNISLLSAESAHRVVKVRLYGLCHAKMCLWAYVDSEGPDQLVQSDQGHCCLLTERMYQWRAKTQMRPCACTA